MVIKVDFDLTMSILAYNLYRLLALETQKYTSFTAETYFSSINKKSHAGIWALQIKNVLGAEQSETRL